jgi:ATP-binding cassette subfamily B protein
MIGLLAGSRRLFAPEVIQTSMMDCGPASLKCLLAGFGIDVGYGRLREACSTDVDGTSIDTLEDVAVELGLDAEQVMVPVDQVLMRESDVLPAILVVQRPHTPAHFIVVWRMHGTLVQVMDPAVGRRWVTAASLLREVYTHEAVLPATDWREWASGDGFQIPLLRRMKDLGLRAGRARALIAEADREPSWKGLATLDAATRFVAKIVAAGGLRGSRSIETMVRRSCELAARGLTLPDAFWSVRAASPGQDGEERVANRGAVLVRIVGRAAPGDARPTETSSKLAPELLAALRQPPASTWGPFLAALRESGTSVVGLILAAIAISGAVIAVQAVLLRGILDLSHWLGIGAHRLGAVAALGAFVALSLIIDVPLHLALKRMGRRIEVLLRVALCSKIPRIGDQYFHSRLISDMADRAHAVSVVRALPVLLGGWLTTAFQLAFTAAGIIWLEPRLLTSVVVVAAAAVGLSVATLRILGEREMRARAQGSTLVRFYLDALMGMTSIRAHGAAGSLMREQEGLLVHWADAHKRMQHATVLIEAAQATVGAALAVWLITGHVARQGAGGSILLLTYWALQLPVLAQALAVSARQFPSARNVLLRLLEPLSAPEEAAASETLLVDDLPPPRARGNGAPPPQRADEAPAVRADVQPLGRSAMVSTAVRREGVRIDMVDVGVRAGGHAVLEKINLSIEPGSQIAIVGESGAGKSTLVGLLLGWHRPATGTLFVDGAPLDAQTLALLRRRTAWVDPSVQLFNRRFVQNLLYGAEDAAADIAPAIEAADLRAVLERLPEGLQTFLGEGGTLVSGGEGQRVRLGRALLRRDVRLVVLDEPFRGLDRERRRLLLDRARRFWTGATIVCVTHDLSHTLDFPRVVVVESGRIVEDGHPQELACDMRSIYQRMLTAEQIVLEGMWANPSWRRVRVENGIVVEKAAQQWIDPPELMPADALANEGERG